MKYPLSFLLSFLLLWSVFSCQPKDEITTDPAAVLHFSADTIFFDTVFVSRGTVTKRLRVYNLNERAVRISEIRLGRAAQSPYRITIDGVEAPLASNIELRGRDSLYILVKASIDPSAANTPFLVTDSITFLINNQLQDVKLVAYGQNAYFHDQEVLSCNTVWEADKPHFITNSVVVKAGCTLTIAPGTRVYSFSNSFIHVEGTLRVEGTAENRVLFTGHRLEPRYEKAPGQWNGIHFMANSRDNLIQFAEVKNAIVGVWADYGETAPGVDVRLENTIIRNMFSTGILSLSGNVSAMNTLIANCGEHAVAGLGGGNYEFIHCTIANYYAEAVRKTPSFVFSNQWSPETGDPVTRQIQLKVVNSIIWGSQDELLIVEDEQTQPKTSQLTFQHNILKSELYQTLLSTATDDIHNNLLSQDLRYPKFRSTNTRDFRLAKASPAVGAAVALPGVNQDLEGNPRKEPNPDIGAYEFNE